MRIGYSNLLGEYVAAAGLTHGDCETFQIVCPACREPLFKVMRSVEREPKPVNYLSHYRRTDPALQSCELRVDRFSSEHIASTNHQTREQRLAYFLDVFREMLPTDPFVCYTKSMQKTHQWLGRSEAWRAMRTRHYQAATAGFARSPEFHETARLFCRDSADNGNLIDTSFAIDKQIDIAADMMATITTLPSRSSYNALFNHAGIVLIQDCHRSDRIADAGEQKVFDTMGGFLSAIAEGGKLGERALRRMRQTPLGPPFLEQPSTYALKIASEIAYHMAGTLVRLPYFEFLRDRLRR